MKRVKVIKRLFKSRTAAKSFVSFYRAKAVENSCSILKTEVIGALEFYRSNSWLKDSVGVPSERDFLILLYIDAEVKVEEKKCKVVRLMPVKKPVLKSFAVISYKKVIVKGRPQVRQIREIVFSKTMSIDVKLKEPIVMAA